MPTLLNWITKEAGDEEIEAIIIGQNVDECPRCGTYIYDFLIEDSTVCPNCGAKLYNDLKILTWEEAKDLDIITREFDNGYGSPGCPPIYVYTKSKIMFIVEFVSCLT